jgi:hypothetical protein
LISELVTLLRESGFGSLVATNCKQRYLRYVRPGDVLTIRHVIGALSDLKRTGLGEGYFLDTVATVTDAAAEPICLIDYRRFYFRPRSAGG